MELIRSEGVFNRQLAVQGGVVVDSIKMASSCFGQTAATLDPQLVLADYLAYAKVSPLPILETNQPRRRAAPAPLVLTYFLLPTYFWLPSYLQRVV